MGGVERDDAGWASLQASLAHEQGAPLYLNVYLITQINLSKCLL